jgi:hypothetical protein
MPISYVAWTNLKIIQIHHSIDSHHFLSSLSYPRIDVLVDTITRAHECIQFAGIDHADFVFRSQILLDRVGWVKTLEQGCCILAAILDDDFCSSRVVIDKIPNGPYHAFNRDPKPAGSNLISKLFTASSQCQLRGSTHPASRVLCFASSAALIIRIPSVGGGAGISPDWGPSGCDLCRYGSEATCSESECLLSE